MVLFYQKKKKREGGLVFLFLPCRKTQDHSPHHRTRAPLLSSPHLLPLFFFFVFLVFHLSHLALLRHLLAENRLQLLRVRADLAPADVHHIDKALVVLHALGSTASEALLLLLLLLLRRLAAHLTGAGETSVNFAHDFFFFFFFFFFFVFFFFFFFFLLPH